MIKTVWSRVPVVEEQLMQYFPSRTALDEQLREMAANAHKAIGEPPATPRFMVPEIEREVARRSAGQNSGSCRHVTNSPQKRG